MMHHTMQDFGGGGVEAAMQQGNSHSSAQVGFQDIGSFASHANAALGMADHHSAAGHTAGSGGTYANGWLNFTPAKQIKISNRFILDLC